MAGLNQKIVIKELKNNKNEFKKFGVKRIALFGSYAINKQKKGSDIDILVKFNRTTFDNYFDLKFFLENIFNKNVDLVIEDNLKPGIKIKEAKYV